MPDAKNAGRLLLTIHHLAVDGVSWRILLPDLQAAWAAIAHRETQGETPALPARGTSFRRWAHELATNALTPERVAELPLWRGMWEAPALSLFDGTLDRARDLTGTARELTLTLPAEVTAALLTRVPAAFHAGINDVLLTGLALAVAQWCRRHGRDGDGDEQRAVLLDVEGHGREVYDREDIATGIDLSRTVGWFTSLFPLRLDPGALERAHPVKALSISMTHWRAGLRPAAPSRPSRSSCARCPTMGWATGSYAISTRRPPVSLRGCRCRRSASTI